MFRIDPEGRRESLPAARLTLYPMIGGSWAVIDDDGCALIVIATREGAIAWAREESKRTNFWVVVDNLEFVAESDLRWE